MPHYHHGPETADNSCNLSSGRLYPTDGSYGRKVAAIGCYRKVAGAARRAGGDAGLAFMRERITECVGTLNSRRVRGCNQRQHRADENLSGLCCAGRLVQT